VDLGLRFDLTVPLARYYANNHAKLPKPLKAVQIGPVWRAERPQKGRFRQFTQCDIDILGVTSEIAEIELILATTEALTALGLEGLTVRINDRRILTAMARWCGFDEARHDSVFIALDKWDKLEPSAIADELRQVGHPAPAIGRMLDVFTRLKGGGELEALSAYVEDAETQSAIHGLKEIIDAARTQTSVSFDATLVRGMSYYTGPIFEIAAEGFSSSIAGGGRYDRLIGKILGQDVPATGFSIGFERVISILMDRKDGRVDGSKRLALVFEETADLAPILEYAHKRRQEGWAVSLELSAKRRGPQRAALAGQGFDSIVEWPDLEIREVGGAR